MGISVDLFPGSKDQKESATHIFDTKNGVFTNCFLIYFRQKTSPMATQPKKKKNDIVPIVLGLVILVAFLAFVVYIASQAVTN